jgi:uncharacterized membrane protein
VTAPERLKMRYAPERPEGVEILPTVGRVYPAWRMALGWLVFSVALAISPAVIWAAWGWLL